MPHFRLFAARDGHVIHATSFHPNFETAEAWAALEIVERFALQDYNFTEFYELVAETDGVLLEEQ